MFDQIVARVLEWHRVRTTLGKLNRLDKHILADIGIERKDIAAVAHGRMAPRR